MKSNDIRILDYSLRRQYIDAFYTRYASTLAENASVLDVEGTKIQKRGQFNIEQYPVQVTYLNISSAKAPDIVADAASMPVEDSRFDVVICSETLEHVPDPRIVLQEIYRVLHPEGILLATIPFLNSIHADPYDYGRYTHYYWEENLFRIGFRDISIEKQGLFWSVLVDIVREAVRHSIHIEKTMKSPYLRTVIYKIVQYAKQKAILWDNEPEKQQHPLHSRFTTGFGIVAKK